jgi:hypothetical protein
MKTQFPLPFALRSLQKSVELESSNDLVSNHSTVTTKPREVQSFSSESQDAPSGIDFGKVISGISQGFIKNKKPILGLVGILLGLFLLVNLITYISNRSSGSDSSSNYNSSVTRYGRINDKDGIRFRSGPGTNYEKLDLLSKGTRIEVLDTNGPEAFLNNANGRWYKIRYGGREGWIFGAFVDLE